MCSLCESLADCDQDHVSVEDSLETVSSEFKCHDVSYLWHQQPSAQYVQTSCKYFTLTRREQITDGLGSYLLYNQKNILKCIHGQKKLICSLLQ